MITIEVGQKWTMIGGVNKGPIEFVILQIDGPNAVCGIVTVDISPPRNFKMPIARLRMGMRGAKCLLNPDGTPYQKPPRVSKRTP